MNIILAIIFSLKRVPECIKMRHFEREHAKIFLGRGTFPEPTPTGRGILPPQIPTPVGAVGASIRVRLVDPQTTFLDTGLLYIIHYGQLILRKISLVNWCHQM